jgi:hypothetical protein
VSNVHDLVVLTIMTKPPRRNHGRIFAELAKCTNDDCADFADYPIYVYCIESIWPPTTPCAQKRSTANTCSPTAFSAHVNRCVVQRHGAVIGRSGIRGFATSPKGPNKSPISPFAFPLFLLKSLAVRVNLKRLRIPRAANDKKISLTYTTTTIDAHPFIPYPLWRQHVVIHSVQGKQVHDAQLAALMQAHAITHILTLSETDFTRYSGITPIDSSSLAAPPPLPP